MGTLTAIIILVIGFVLAFLLNKTPDTILGINFTTTKIYLLVIVLALCVWIIPI